MDQAVTPPVRISETPPIMIIDGRLLADVGTTVWIPLEYIVPNPDQPRKFFDDEELEAMAESYKHRGDVEKAIDVILRDHGDSTIALIQDGESRWRSAKITQLSGVSCYICPDKSDDEIFLSSAVANIRRKDFTIIEKALAIFQIQQRFKLTEAAAGAKLGYKPSQTTYLLKFLDLIEEIQMLFMRGKIGAGIAYQLAACPPNQQKAGLKAIMGAVKENDGKPIHHNKAARIIRGDMEKRGVKPKQPARGRSHSTHAQLVARNLLTKASQFADAIKEFAALDQKAIKDLTDPHFLDIENSLQSIVRSAQKQLERLSRQT